MDEAKSDCEGEGDVVVLVPVDASIDERSDDEGRNCSALPR
jgi:hypothetical protein